MCRCTTYCSQLRGVLLDRLGVQHLPVVFADIEVLLVVLREGDLLLVEPQLQVRHVVCRLDGRVVNAARLLLLFALFLVLLQLLGCLLRSPRKVLGADLPAQNACLCPVALLYAKRNLLQDELGLLSSGHRAEGLDLELAEDVRRRGDVALFLLDVGKYPRYAGPLDFDEDLPLVSNHTATRIRCAYLALSDGP